MEKYFQIDRVFVRVFICLLLLFPFLSLIYYIDRWEFPEKTELLHVLQFTLWQSALSAIVTVVLGFLTAQGLLAWQKHRVWLEFLSLIPNLVPTLFVIVAFLKFFDPFPFGLWGIVLLHSVLNIGLVAIAFVRLFEEKVAGWAELSLVEGASQLQFISVVVRFLRKEILLLFLFVFSISFSSFTVPLVVGGYQGTTLEVLIYEKIKIDASWSQALSISFLQTLFTLFFAFLLSKQKSSGASKASNLKILANPMGVLIPLVITILVLLGQLEGSALGLRQLQQLSGIQNILFENTLNSLSVSFGVGLLVALLLAAIAYGSPHLFFQRFLMGYSAPSAVIGAFAFLVFFRTTGLLQIILALSLLYLPYFYRLRMDSRLDSLDKQIQIALTLGADWFQIFKEVILPQISKTLGFLGGLAAFWAAGDFAVSSIISGRSQTLSMLSKELLGSYRLEAASLLNWLVLLVGLFVWFVFWRVGHVLGRKSHS